jgi:glycosyltransferase involved in cell wall biosynthesis
MKKIAIIAPSSLANMPFLEYYEDILKEYGIPYDLFYWDRFHVDKESGKGQRYTCNFPSKGLGSICGYVGYRRFLLNHLKIQKYSFHIVLTVQMGILIRQYLKGKKYILDIRDFSHEGNHIYKALADKVIFSAVSVTISSDGFRQWLPDNREYVLSHNVALASLQSNFIPPNFNSERLVISYIGAVGYLEANVQVINAVADCPLIHLRYIGSGICEEDLQTYCINNGIGNVEFLGRYQPTQKSAFYKESDFVLACYGQKTLLERTLIPNRLYESCYLGRPIIVNKGTYLAEIVSKHGLGIVVDLDDLNGLYSKISGYIDMEMYQQYLVNCEQYIEKVKGDIRLFKAAVGRLVIEHI